MKKSVLILALSLAINSGMAEAKPGDTHFYRKATECMQQENYQGAVEAYTKFLYIYPDSYSVYAERAEAKEKMGNLKAAIADYTLAINKTVGDKRLIKLYTKRAECKENLKDYNGAIEDFNYVKFLAKQNNDFTSYKNVLVSIKNAEKEKAAQIANGSKQGPSAKKYMAMAKRDFAAKNYTVALEKINKAAELDIDNPFIIRQRGIAKLKLRDVEGALFDLYRARDIYEKQLNFDAYEKILGLIEKIESNIKN